MATTQKIWSGEVANQYPKQWIVFVEVECDPETHKHMGIVHLVTPDKNKAYKAEKALGNSMGNTVVIEGFDDTPRIGGLSAWSK